MDNLVHDIRYTDPTDVVHLRAWLQPPAILHWFPMSTEKEIEDAVQCWIGFCRWSASLTATVDQVPCAIGTLFLMPYKKVAHHCLFKLIVDPKWQKQGIGFSLLRNLKHLAKNYFHLEMMSIEIFEGNPLLSLLKKEGFYEVVRQEHFVKEEQGYLARLIMETVL